MVFSDAQRRLGGRSVFIVLAANIHTTLLVMLGLEEHSGSLRSKRREEIIRLRGSGGRLGSTEERSIFLDGCKDSDFDFR